MNYVGEINRFHDWLPTHSVSVEAQALWYFLMALNNRDGWGTQFQASNQMICGILGLSSTTLWRGRGELVTAGRITFKIGKGGRPPTYHLVPFIVAKAIVPVDKAGDKSQGKTRSFPRGKRYGNPMGMRRGIRMGKRMGKSVAREA